MSKGKTCSFKFVHDDTTFEQVLITKLPAIVIDFDPKNKREKQIGIVFGHVNDAIIIKQYAEKAIQFFNEKDLKNDNIPKT